jgi:hypothetical protein
MLETPKALNTLVLSNNFCLSFYFYSLAFFPLLLQSKEKEESLTLVKSHLCSSLEKARGEG